MKKLIVLLTIIYISLTAPVSGQTITYSEVEKSDNRNANFEILGRFGENFLVYKNFNRRQNITIYNNDMSIKETVKLDFVSDKTYNIDFVTYPDHFLMVWQYQRNNTWYCKGANMDAMGKIIGEVMDLDTTHVGIFENNPSYDLAKSEDRKNILLYKVQTRNDVYSVMAKIYDEVLHKKDSTRIRLEYNDRRESFGDLQIDNEGTIVFSKERQTFRADYIASVVVNFRKLASPVLTAAEVPLDKQLIKDVRVNIDNLNARYLVTSFAYINAGDVAGLFTAVINRDSFKTVMKSLTILDDSVMAKLSGRPSRSTAYNNYFMRF